MPSCTLLGGSLPSSWPDELPWASTSSTPYSSFPSPPHQVTKRGDGVDFFSPKEHISHPTMPQTQYSFLLDALNNPATPSKKEQKENPSANGKRSKPGHGRENTWKKTDSREQEGKHLDRGHNLLNSGARMKTRAD